MTAKTTIKVESGSHFFRETEGGSGYGSGRPGHRLTRCLALEPLPRQLLGCVDRQAMPYSTSGGNASTTGAILAMFCNASIALKLICMYSPTANTDWRMCWPSHGSRMQVHDVQLENPRHLPLATRNWLIQQEPIADLTLYLEDDLVIVDPLFLDKQHWFLESNRRATGADAPSLRTHCLRPSGSAAGRWPTSP